MTRRDFVKHSSCALMTQLVCGAMTGLSRGQTPQAQQVLLLEAERFDSYGGWELDQQSIEQMGSPYLLAHGLGVPVQDAMTTAHLEQRGEYRVWVRTRDWVAPWNAPGAPGRFQVLVNGKPLDATFGTEGADWHWQDGGTVRLEAGDLHVALRDLTGFEGRCDSVLFCSDPAFVPPDTVEELERFRRAALGLPAEPVDGGSFDLVVSGGGIAGCCAALAAARNGLTVALIQDRPILGGNGSSEVRVWPEGHTLQQPFDHVGDIVEEILPMKKADTGNAKAGSVYQDARKQEVLAAEPRLTLLTNHRVRGVEAEKNHLRAVVAEDTRTGVRKRIVGKFFADCTGDATVGYLAKADYEMTRQAHQGMSNLWNVLDQDNPHQVLKCECKDKAALAIATEAGDVAAPFPRCPWALDLSDKPFPGRSKLKGQWGGDAPLDNLGAWFWESGFDRDPIDDVERIRDLNLRAMYGAWDALKNVDHLYPNHRIGWAAFIAGKRESRRLMGDVILSVEDFKQSRVFEDPAFPCSWHIDVHSPDGRFAAGLGQDSFISVATEGKDYRYVGPYWAPYRCLYSWNIDNLFMAGRNISVTHDALGPVRVMRTCGMMGEAIGKAAWICVSHNTTPRGVYEKHLPLFKQLLDQPGSSRRTELAGKISGPDYNLGTMLRPIPAEACFTEADYNIWCGSAVAEDGGKYHLYYSRWPKHLGHEAWVTHSEVAHASATSPLGPWEHHDVALPARGREFWDGSCTHNPTVLRIGRKYYLYYMGNTGDGEVRKPLNWIHRNNQRIGVAVADSPNGPWTRMDKPLIDCTPGSWDALCCNNPAVTRRPEGGFLMVYKAVGDKGKVPFGGPVVHIVATSDSPTGPFEKHPSPVFTVEGETFATEDPFIWRGVDRYWAVVKDNAGHFTGSGYSLALFESKNGLEWRQASHPLVTTPVVRWASSAESRTLAALERPQILFKGDLPAVLYCAAADNPRRDGSMNLAIPLTEI